VLPTDGSAVVVREGVTDAQGQVTLDVPPGRYWAVVPATGQRDGSVAAGALVSELPSGGPVHASQEVTLHAGETVPVAPSIRIMLP
jgi:hypothetical protein